MADRKKPCVAFWATAVVVVALAYYLSLGPVFWLVNTLWPGKIAMPHWAALAFGLYCTPFALSLDVLPESVGNVLGGYVDWWIPR
jgi:hypothetical protein